VLQSKEASDLGVIVPPLTPDGRIASLALATKRVPSQIDEDSIKAVLKPYKLQDALIEIGWWSIRVHFFEPERLVGKTAWQEPKTGLLITQHALAYLTNISLICRAADYKEPLLSANEDNVPALCGIYHHVSDPYQFEEVELSGEDRLQAFLFRTYYEQMRLQFRPNYLIARTLLMFLNPGCDEGANLNDVFTETNGLSLYEYLRLAFVVFAALREGPSFTQVKFTATDIPELKVDLSEEAISSFLNILATDYSGFLKRDQEMNEGMDPQFTKNRYNPLFEYPIIEVDIGGAEKGYVVPNVVGFLFKAFGGLFWWFHTYYEKAGRDPLVEFRTPFGKVFEDYVGIILKDLYGEEKVHGEVVYGDGRRFIDWYVEDADRYYLFESKAYQFAFVSQQKGYKEVFLENEAGKILGAIKQVYNRVKDIDVYEELARFRDKPIVPIIVFLDIPYPSGTFVREWIDEAQKALADAEGNPELGDFTVHLMNIKELELCEGIDGIVPIDEILEKAPKEIQYGFEGLLAERLGRPLQNQMLEKKCNEFLDSILATN
jgi:hypothetical protein